MKLASRLLQTTTLSQDTDTPVIEKILFQRMDLLAWLYYKEHGFYPPIEAIQGEGRENLKKVYLVNLWLKGADHLKKILSTLTPEEHELVRQRIKQVLIWSRPFMVHWRSVHGEQTEVTVS